MGRSLAGYALVAACLGMLAFARVPEPATPAMAPAWLLLPLAALGIVATAAASLLAWRADNGTAAFVALGAGAITAGTSAFAGASLATVPAGGPGPALLPVVGLGIAGACFAVAALTAHPDSFRSQPRTTLLVGLAALAAGAVLLAVQPAIAPPAPLVRTAACLGATGAIFGFVASYQSWRLVRLPSLAMLGLASASVAGALISYVTLDFADAVGGAEVAAAATACATLASLALVLEQRVRPGLRSLVLGLALPAAASAIARSNPSPMHALLDAVQDYDDSLRGHVSRVAALSVRMGMRMRLNASHLREIALAAQLHDVGKIAIPRAILCKPGTLTPEQFEVMKRHTTIGEHIVSRVPDLAVAVRGVGEHHERWDGAGYPYGREGDAISLTARIVAVADVYDALVSRRAYKQGWSRDDAIAEITRGAGSHFDPRVVDELLRVVGEADRATRTAAA